MAKRTPKEVIPAPVLSIYDKVNQGYYQTKLTYPARSNPDFKALKAAYNEDQQALEDLFRKDLFDEFGVTDNPKADLCYSKAWSHGHASGYADVLSYFADIVELIQ